MPRSSGMPNYFAPGRAPVKGQRIPLGQAHVLRSGRDVTLVSYSRTVADCLAVAEKLAPGGIDAEVIDLRTISPLDMETVLKSVERTRRLVVVHEAVKPFGVGAEIVARTQEELFGQLAAPIERVGAHHCPVPFAKNLESEFTWDGR